VTKFRVFQGHYGKITIGDYAILAALKFGIIFSIMGERLRARANELLTLIDF
jgi:hypothetical protein